MVTQVCLGQPLSEGWRTELKEVWVWETSPCDISCSTSLAQHRPGLAPGCPCSRRGQGPGVSLQQEGPGPHQEGHAAQQAEGLWMAIDVQEAPSPQSREGTLGRG